MVSDSLEYLILGLSIGGAYALIAVGYTMVYGIIQLINFAHGEIFMFGAFCTFALISPTAARQSLEMALFLWVVFMVVGNFAAGLRLRALPLRLVLVTGCASALAAGFYFLCLRHVSFYLAVPISMVVTACLGVAIDRMAYAPLRHAPRLAPLITAIGMSLFLSNIMMVVWGARTRAYPEDYIPRILTVPARVRGEWFSADMRASMTWMELLTERHEIRLWGDQVVSILTASIFVTSITLMLLLNLVIHHTKLGRAMRACAEDKTVAALMGVNVDRTIAATFAIGSALAAVGGTLYALNYRSLKPTMGYWAGVVAFAAAVLGGIGNVTGAMIGGFVIGVAAAFATPLGVSNWANGVAFAIMIAVIIFRPSGILGKAPAKRA